MRSGVEFVAQI